MSEKATIVLAGGCFWCLDAVYRLVRGVSGVVCGYSGGDVENPSYEAVCSGTTGHAEAVEVSFDPKVVSLTDILEIFFFVHDPTTLNRQGNDAGTQYRSAIFYRDDEQKGAAEAVSAGFAAELWDKPIVTQVVPLDKFWPADEHQQDYFQKNPSQAYCQVIINPKLAKFRHRYESKLK